MEAENCCESLVAIYHTTWRHIAVDLYLNIHGYENLISHGDAFHIRCCSVLIAADLWDTSVLLSSLCHLGTAAYLRAQPRKLMELSTRGADCGLGNHRFHTSTLVR